MPSLTTAVPSRIAWVTPDYPPDRGGVSDHSHEMVNALRAVGHEVLVCRRPHEHGFALLNAELTRYRPDLVVLAFTPLGYAPRTGGLAPALMRWSVGLGKRLQCDTLLLAHEVGLPVVHHLRNLEPKFAALGAAQIAQFSILAASFDSVLFSNAGTYRDWARRVPPLANRIRTVRICSNIPYVAHQDPRSALVRAGYTVAPTTILFFGTGHQSVLLDYVERAFQALLLLEPNACLVIVGMSAEKLRQQRPSLAELGARVQALGYVPGEHVSEWLQLAALVLAPLIEGVSARKGTVMAALQHGQAVVTTRGTQTLNDIQWDDICILTPLDCEAFAAVAVRAFRDPSWRAAVGGRARAEYEAHASASVTAAEIVEFSRRNSTRRA